MFKLRKFTAQSIEIDNPLVQKMDVASEGGSGKRTGNVKNNYLVVWFFMTVVLGLLCSRIIYLQVIKGGYYQGVAENNRIRAQIIKAPRGLIKDQYGEVLARNVPSFDAVFVPAEMPEDYQQRKVMYRMLGEMLTMNESNIESMVESIDRKKKESFLLKENIGHDPALQIEEKFDQLRGIYVENTARREYVDGLVFSPVIGYDGKINREELQKNPGYLMTDYIGKNGLEYSYEKELHGVHGEHRMEVDSNGSVKEDLGIVNPVQGDELDLYLDAKLQHKTYEVLDKILGISTDATGAAAVAIDVKTGGVLALVNAPGYDNNLFSGGISHEDYVKLINDERHPMTNRSVSGEYPPGSTFKPLMAAAALEDKIITENTTLNCLGRISVGSWNFPDWTTHGMTDVKKAIAESCDVFFYAIGGGWEQINAMGISGMGKYAKMFGLGSAMGIDLPWEAKGLIPDEDWKGRRFGEKWYIGDNYHCSIGQGFITATPLQMAVSISVIANDGILYKPQLVKSIVHSDTKKNEEIQPVIIRENFISKQNLRIVREGMRQTVTDGSAKQMGTLEVQTAGKTGTAQFGNEGKLHSWYVSFAPYDNPQIAMAVLVEGGGEGHTWAVPATREIYRWYFDEKRGSEPKPSDSFENSLKTAKSMQGD